MFIDSNSRSENENRTFSVKVNSFVARHEYSVLRHFAIDKNGIQQDYLVRVINKSTLKKNSRRLSFDVSDDVLDGIDNLYNELEIRKQLSHPNLLSLYAIRDTTNYVILCWFCECFVLFSWGILRRRTLHEGHRRLPVLHPHSRGGPSPHAG